MFLPGRVREGAAGICLFVEEIGEGEKEDRTLSESDQFKEMLSTWEGA